MPLLLSLESPHGAHAEWWVVRACGLDFKLGVASVVLAGYVSQKAHDDGKDQLFEMVVKDAADLFQKLCEMNNLRCTTKCIEAAVLEVVENFKGATYHPPDTAGASE